MEIQDDLYEFIDQFVTETNSGVTASAVPTLVEQNASVVVVIGIEVNAFKQQYGSICHERIKSFPLTSSIPPSIRVRCYTQEGEIKVSGLIISMPQAATCFCTHCLGTISPIEEEIDQHVKNCYAKTFSTEYCQICNAKNTADTAAAHYSSKSHEKKAALHTALSRNQQKYYVSTNGVSTDSNSNVLKRNVVFYIDPQSAEKLAAIRALENTHQKTDEEKLHDLIEQMATNKAKTTDLVGKELTQRNECIKMFHSLLASINIGYVPCYYPRSKGDFIHPAVLLEAVKKSAIKKMAKSEIGKKNPEKIVAIESIFTPKVSTDDHDLPTTEYCRICKTEHETKYYSTKQVNVIFKMIEGVMNSI